MSDAIHPQVRALMRAWAAAGPATEPDASAPGVADLAAARAGYLELALELGGVPEPVASVVELVIPHGEVRLPARLVTPLHAPDTRDLIVWLHGGGWYLGDIASFDHVARALANASGAKVLLPEYRLTPEHRWPTQIGDADAIARWARAEGAEQLVVDPARVRLGGDSAGAHLAVAAARHARDDGLPAVTELLLVYPCLDPTGQSEAMREFADGPVLTRADVERCWALYRTDAARLGDPDFAPLMATDWSGMPTTRVAVAGQDPLRDDGLTLADLLADAGIPTRVRVFEDMVHGFLRWGGVVDATGELLAWLGKRPTR